MAFRFLRIPPWSGRRGLALSIDGAAEAARAVADGMDARQARLWEFLCEASRRTLRRLLADGGDPMMDWGLRKYARRVDAPKLIVLFWWMLLYQMVLFRNRGMDDLDPDAEIDAMHAAARRFLKTELARAGADFAPPEPWAKDWRRQFTLESAMALYNRIYMLLGIPGDLTKRINHVSHFTTATERAYDRMAREFGGPQAEARR